MVGVYNKIDSMELLQLLLCKGGDACLLRVEAVPYDADLEPSIRGSVTAICGKAETLRSVEDIECCIPLVDRIVFKAREYCDTIVVYSSKRGDAEKRIIGKVCKILAKEGLAPNVVYLNSYKEFRAQGQMLEPDLADLHEESTPSCNSSEGDVVSLPGTPTPLSLNDRRQRAHSAVFTHMTTSTSCKCSPPTMILHNLFLGNAQNAANTTQLYSLNIQHIVNVSTEVPNFHEARLAYTTYRVPDTEESAHLLAGRFNDLCDLIEEAVIVGPVLVHCFVGVSRSCAVITAYLMRSYGWSLQEALEYIRVRRPMVSPNSGLMRALKDFEEQM